MKTMLERNGWCPNCGKRVPYCGSKPVFRKDGSVVQNEISEMYVVLYYCDDCNGNIEFTRLLDEK